MSQFQNARERFDHLVAVINEAVEARDFMRPIGEAIEVGFRIEPAEEGATDTSFKCRYSDGEDRIELVD